MTGRKDVGVSERQSADGTVGKALEVLDRVAAFGRPVRFSEVLEGSTFPKATLYRFVQTLTNQGMLSFDPDRQTYAPGVRLVRLAHAAWAQSSLAPVARPHLDRLSALVGETVHLAQMDNAQVLYVDKRNAAMPVEMFSQAGKVGPAYCTGVGKAMLAHLDEATLARVIKQQSFHAFTPNTLTTESALRAELDAIRTRGHAFDREEHEPGIICIAMPILSSSRRLMGALSVTGTTRRITLAELEKLAPTLRETAQAIARDAQDWRFPENANQAKGI
ncbi:MAG: helix-turn-helix domain-containing protein [Limimaricola sp.]|uniref:IclR family transcriptional regulator n=1 Tax=Limimaricola sp. TaxID=2211665 RepID=UPI001D7A09DC|nr:IclR family transcriptional regulator [Limimaricola sp.]MBI1417544.1 helix-turn-helix domain-containing protein [Limimaricola sp.]